MRMRKYWRRAISRSWILSKWYYRLHGLQLTGRASDAVWYFAYGSNMHEGAFLERRLMRPTEWRVGRLKGYRLRFNLDGVPKGKTAPANVCVKDIVDAIVYLTEAQNVTGESLHVDGGAHSGRW
jgi:NAD(P)-dependent dehydrogenase (short-subunit alcohol dehydrogenase family)